MTKWKGLNRAAGYINPWDVWAKHPDRPATLTPTGQHVIVGKSHNWWVSVPRPVDHTPVQGDSGSKGKGFDSFSEAADWAAKRLGVKGWRRVSVNRMAVWLPDDDSDERGCDVHMARDMGRWTEFSTCGRVAVGEISARFKRRPDEKTAAACQLHITVERKRKERDAAMRAEWTARGEENRREAENRKAAEDYCARLASYGIKADPAEVDGRYTGAVAIQGETAVRLVEEVDQLRRELGLPPLADEPIR